MNNELEKIIVPDVGQHVNPYINSVNGNVVDELDLDGELDRSVALEVIAGE